MLCPVERSGADRGCPEQEQRSHFRQLLQFLPALQGDGHVFFELLGPEYFIRHASLLGTRSSLVLVRVLRVRTSLLCGSRLSRSRCSGIRTMGHA